MADKKSLFDWYKSEGRPLDSSGLASRQDFINFLKNRLGEFGGTLDDAALGKLVDKIDVDGKGVSAEEAASLTIKQLVEVAMESANEAGKGDDDGFLKKTVLDMMAVVAPVRRVQQAVFEEIEKNYKYAAGESNDRGKLADWLSKNGGYKIATVAMDGGLGRIIAAINGDNLGNASSVYPTGTSGKFPTLGEMWDNDKGTLFALLGTAIAFFVMVLNGSMGLLFIPLMMGAVGYAADHGMMGSGGAAAATVPNAAGSAPAQGQVSGVATGQGAAAAAQPTTTYRGGVARGGGEQEEKNITPYAGQVVARKAGDEVFFADIDAETGATSTIRGTVAKAGDGKPVLLVTEFKIENRDGNVAVYKISDEYSRSNALYFDEKGELFNRKAVFAGLAADAKEGKVAPKADIRAMLGGETVVASAAKFAVSDVDEVTSGTGVRIPYSSGGTNVSLVS